MFQLLLYCFLLNGVLTYQKWIPNYENENTFNEPYDFVDDKFLPNFENFGNGYDWISIAGSSIMNQKQAFIAFTGTRNNNVSNYNSVFTRQSGIIILCSANLNNNSSLGFDIKCKSLEEQSLDSSTGKYFGAVVKSVKLKNDAIAFIYCDPLWINDNLSLGISNGKCKLTIVENSLVTNTIDYPVCDKFKKCLGGFSVDIIAIDDDVKIIFGLPFENSTKLSYLVDYQKIRDGPENKGTYFNYGYSVAFSGDGSQYASSPVDNGYFPYVTMVNGEKFKPTDLKTQRYGGFGTSMDTVNLGDNLYAVIIGAPYQSRQNLVNAGAVFLACKGKPTDVVFGENAYDNFGYSVARLGDIDSNGSEEFVVGAPSLNLDKPGKIYIFKTIKSCQIFKKPLQIYQSKFSGFGVAISRGFDINFNDKPDFFVTALGYQKPFLFVMPNQEKVTCSWVEPSIGIFISEQSFELKVMFQFATAKDYKVYDFQVAIDILKQGEPRFKLNKTELVDDSYTLTLQPLLDVQDMDFKSVPFKVAIKGIRKCKISGKKDCYLSKTSQVEWDQCEKIIKLSQRSCFTTKCNSELSINSVVDAKGNIIYHGDQTDYQRTILIVIYNNGPTSLQRIHMSIAMNPDIRIDKIVCSMNCKPELTAGQHASVLVKNQVDMKDNVNIAVDILYNEMEIINSKTFINFTIWSINDDDNMSNNNFTMEYKVLFKPILMISSKNTKENNIDSRIKPPYLERLHRISVQDLGTELSYSYLMENKGPELKNVTLKFLFPYKIQTDKYVLYLMDKIRLSTDEKEENALPSINNKDGLVRYCHVAKEMLNPLNVIASNYKKSGTYSRLKRSANELNFPSNSVSQNDQSQPEANVALSSISRTSVIKCNESTLNLGTPICGEITCRLDIIPKNSDFTFDFRAWVFTKTFFDARIPHLTLITTLQAYLEVPKGLPVAKANQIIGPILASQNVLFNKMKVDEDKPMPLWPIIVAIIIGIFLLVIIILIAYYCGFFKRKRLRKERQKIREKANKNKDPTDNTPLNSKSRNTKPENQIGKSRNTKPENQIEGYSVPFRTLVPIVYNQSQPFHGEIGFEMESWNAELLEFSNPMSKFMLN